MLQGPKEEFYVTELRSALQDYQRVAKEVYRLLDDKRQKARLVKGLLSVMRLQSGEGAAQNLLEKSGLLDLARPFLTLENLHTPGSSFGRRRGSDRTPVEPSAVLQKGSRVKMMTGTYDGYVGVVASSQLRQGRRGLDVTYFLNLEGPKGDRKRTSVKHGTLGKSWVLL